jgi:hypothetical protein
LGDVYDIRPADGALIPIAATMGDNDYGQNPFLIMSEVHVNNSNYFAFLHGNDIVTGNDPLSNIYNLTGFGIEIYGLNLGFNAYSQKNKMLDWLVTSLKKNPSSFKIAFYHAPLFPACGNKKLTLEEFDEKRRLRQIFTTLGVKLAFEHHEDLYKLTYPMKNLMPISDASEKGKSRENSTIYLGGGQWGTPKSK